MKQLKLIISLLLLINIISLAQIPVSKCTDNLESTYPIIRTELPAFDWEKFGLNDSAPYKYDFLYWTANGNNYTTDPLAAAATPGMNYQLIPNILSPWETDDLNTADFKSAIAQGAMYIDNLHEEGWEIIQKNFGTSEVPVSKSPFFILYNKFQGYLRIFVLVHSTTLDAVNASNPTSALVKLYFRTGGQNALLSHGSSILNGTQEFEKDILLAVPNKLGGDAPWLRADFPMYYDQCTCINPILQAPDLRVGVDILSEANLKTTSYFSGNITGSINGSSSESGVSYDDKESQDIQYSANIGSETSNNASSFKPTTATTGTSTPKGKNSGNDPYYHPVDRNLNGQSKPRGQAQCAGGLRIEDLCEQSQEPTQDAGYYDYYNGSSTFSSSTSSFSAEVNLQFSGTASTSGTITTGVTLLDKGVFAPGSNIPNYSPSTQEKHPYYNNPLGVVSLLKTPALEVIEYVHNGNFEIAWSCPQILCTYFRKAIYTTPKIREYKLKEDLQYTINPSADVEVVDINASLIFKYDPTKMPANTIFPQKATDAIKLFGVDYPNTQFQTGEDNNGDPNYCDDNNSSNRKPISFKNCAGEDYIKTINRAITMNSDDGADYNFYFLNGPVMNNVIASRLGTYNEYKASLLKSGLEIDIENVSQSARLVDYTFGTKYASLGCLKDTRVKFYDVDGVFPDVKLKIVFTLRKKLPDNLRRENVEKDFVVIQTYNVSQNSSDLYTSNPSGGTYHYTLAADLSTEPIMDILSTRATAFDAVGRTGWENPNPFEGDFQDIINITDPISITENTSISAFSSINISNNISTSLSSTYSALAGNKVDLTPSTGGRSVLTGNVRLISNEYYSQPSACVGNQVPAATLSQINAVCDSRTTASYYTRTGYSSRLEAGEATIASSPASRNIGTPNLTAIPNPTNGQVTFYYKVPTDGEISISINNILGTKITDVLKNEFKSTGQYQKQLDLSQLAVGVYMVTIETNGYKQTERLVISK